MSAKFANVIKILLALITIYLLLVLAFWLEGDYQSMIRNVYEVSSSHNISFHNPAKYMHFASGLFMFSFVAFVFSCFFLLKSLTIKQRVIHTFLIIAIFIISVILSCAGDGVIKLIECTRCDDGTRELRYEDVPYDIIFVSSQIWAILPIFITTVRIRRQRLKRK